MSWSEYDVAAVVGVGAWIPHVLGWINRALAKPRLKITIAATPEVGFTNFGSILNLNCALSVSRKDALVENVTVTLQHEHGQRTEFVWSILHETFSQLRSTTGESTEVSRSQLAIALKVSTLALVEKIIGFRELAYEQGNRELNNAVTVEMNRFRRAKANVQEEMAKSASLTALMDFMGRCFIWQPGLYRGTISARMAGVKEPASRDFQFTLSQEDVNLVRENLTMLRRVVDEYISPPTKPSEEDVKWNWAAPHLTAV